MTIPEFSLIITTYNSSRTIDQALKSLENLEDAKSIEVVIADDASQDDTLARITDWAHRHKYLFNNIIVIPNGVNLGIAGNHTIAFQHATAKFGTYIGGDDYFTRPDFFRNLRRFTEANLRIAKTNLTSFFEDTGKTTPTFSEVARFFTYPLSMQKRLLCLVGNIIAGGPGTILHIPTLKRLGYFGKEIRVFEDFQVYLSFLFAGHRIRLLPIQGIAWRRHSGSLSYSQNDRMLLGQGNIFSSFIHPNLHHLPYVTRSLTKLRYAFPAGIWVKLLCPLWWGHLLRVFLRRPATETAEN